MITYQLLQQYWWLLVSLLGALVVFLMFVQGANTQIFSLGRTEEERALIVNSTGRKWEFTFTTLVTFGGAFFASFPLFYSTSFGGAYWVWMLILFSFVLQAVSYEFQSKLGNFLGKNTYRWCLVLNGVLGPVLLGTAVGTFFHGASFVVNKEVMTDQLAPAISQWTTAWHGLEAVANPWNVVLGLVVFFLSRVLGDLYMLNNIADETLTPRIRRQVLSDTVPFLILFLAFANLQHPLSHKRSLQTHSRGPRRHVCVWSHRLWRCPPRTRASCHHLRPPLPLPQTLGICRALCPQHHRCGAFGARCRRG